MVRCVCKSHCSWELFFLQYLCRLSHVGDRPAFSGASSVAIQDCISICQDSWASVWELHSLKMSLFYLCIWMVVGTNFLSKFRRYSFTVFKFPVLASWSCSFVYKLFTLSPTGQESFSIIFLSPCPLKLHDVLWCGSFHYCAGRLVLYDVDTLFL